MSFRQDKYFPNMEIKVKGYGLSIMRHGDVYNKSPEGFRKLESLWQNKIGVLSVVLPNNETIQLKPSKKGRSVIEKEATI